MEIFIPNLVDKLENPQGGGKKTLWVFELDYPNAYLNWEKLEPAIASWLFLLEHKVQILKKKAKEHKEMVRDMDRQIKHIHELQEQNRNLAKKCSALNIQNKALIEYRK